MLGPPRWGPTPWPPSWSACIAVARWAWAELLAPPNIRNCHQTSVNPHVRMHATLHSPYPRPCHPAVREELDELGTHVSNSRNFIYIMTDAVRTHGARGCAWGRTRGCPVCMHACMHACMLVACMGAHALQGAHGRAHVWAHARPRAHVGACTAAPAPPPPTSRRGGTPWRMGDHDASRPARCALLHGARSYWR
jgi:hypothetical protein